jgi:hypothetical protein
MGNARGLTIGLAVLAAVLAGSWAEAQTTRPSQRPWTLDVTVTAPHRVAVKDPGQNTVLFTYLTYEITNRTLRDVDIVPRAVLVTDTHKTYTNQTRPDVKAIAERREGGPLLDGSQMMGVLKVGEKKRGIIVFRDVDLTAKVWDLYLAGLSNEYVNQLIPGETESLILYKAYHVQYRNVGDVHEPTDDELVHEKSEWTYR